jgi:hypothetical protein
MTLRIPLPENRLVRQQIVNTVSSMNHRILLLITLLCSASHAAAQGWSGGIKGGVGQGGFSGSREFDWQRMIPSTAIFLNRRLSERLSFQPELVQTRRIGVSNVGTSTLTLTADQLHLPLLMQLKLPSAGGLLPFLIAGPSVGVKLNCTLEFVGGGIRSVDDCDASRGVRSHRFDFGVAAGGGVALPMGALTFGIEGRIAAGLRTFVVPLDQQNSRSYGWSVLAGLSTPLRRSPISRAPRPGPALEQMRPPPSILPDLEVEPDRPVSPERNNVPRRISVNAVDADARALLLAIAKEAGLNIVVSSDVRTRVSLTLSDVPAWEAVQAIISVAGLSVMTPTQAGASPAVVFYHLPVDVNKASAEGIAARFGVSSEMGKWIVESRPERTRIP